MSKNLAIFLASIIISELKKHTSRDFSSYEYELLEKKLMQGKYDEIEQYISNTL